jgi:acyl-CoA synthetase (AMP-forming)/AMP-acid ligase II
MDALVADHARTRPDQLAFADGSEAVTWKQLHRRVRALGAGLVGTGLVPGAVVGIQMSSCVEHAVVVFAVAAAGAVGFELPPDGTPAQIADALDRSGAELLFSDGERPAVEVPALSGSMRIVRDIVDLAGDPDSALPGQDPDDVSVLLGTSGTTGTPKIVMRTANGTLAMARDVVSRSGVGPDDVFLIAAPVSGGIGYINGLCGALATGCTVVLTRSLEADDVIELIERYRATALTSVPTILRRMAAALGASNRDISSLRLLQSGGAFIHPESAELLESRFGCPVISAYGAVDLGSPSMVAADDFSAAHRHATVGFPFPQAELRLIDETGADVGEGEIGEVVMRGPNTALGYFADPDATQALFDDKGWGHFGDLGRIDEDGYLRIVGRIKEIINRGGKKLSIDEIEGHVRGCPGVLDVAVVGYADSEMGERCAAIVVTAPTLELTVDRLQSLLSERGVPKSLWPERIIQVDVLPISPQGKVRRRDLRVLVEGGTNRLTPESASQG